MDLTGIDVSYYAQTARFEETGDPADRPTTGIAGRFQRGELGRKTCKGW